MADLKSLQKKLIGLLHQQLSQYFKQVQILSYKPSSDGKVSGKFIGDRRNYTFILSNNQIQYLPSTTKMDSALATAPKGLTQCTGSNHPCKGEKGTRCVPQNQSCKQREATSEGLARLQEISAASKEITGLVATNKPAASESKQNAQPISKEAPELDKDISLYDFMKHYSPWRAKGSEGFDKAKLRDVKRSAPKPKQNAESTNNANTEPETNADKKEAKANQREQSEPETKPKQLGSGKKTEQQQRAKQPNPKATNPYEFLGISPQDFPDDAALYKAAKVAYRNLSRKYHPDKGGDPKMMIELNNVMDKLKALRKRTDSRRA